MTLRLCSFCGSAPGDHPGHRAAICSDCVRGLASRLGWTMLPPGPLVRSTHEALESLLLGFPEVQLRGVSLVHQVVLRLGGPLPPDGLAWLLEEITNLMGGPEAVVVKATAETSSDRAVHWVEGAAAPLYLALPGREAEPVCLAENLPALQAYGGLMPADTALRDLADGVCALAVGEFDVAGRHLARIDSAFSMHPEAALADAVRLALQGDWPLALEALARLEGRSSGLVQRLARLNRARLLLLHRRVRPAEDALDRLPSVEARELREGLTPEAQRRAECAQGLQRIALALHEFHRIRGGWPSRLADLQPAFLTVLPQCGSAPFRYRRNRKGFRLECASPLHPELPRGWPRWLEGLGVATRPAEVPEGSPSEARGLSGPLESLAPRRPTRGFWVAACREGAGDLPGAALALRGVGGGEAALYRALLLVRRDRLPEAREEFREAVCGGDIVLTCPDLLEAWLAPALERASRAALSGLFLGLLRSHRTDLVERMLPYVREQRLRFLCEAAPVLPAGTLDWPLRRGLEAAFDHRTPEAALCLELAVVEGEGAASALLTLARQYRLAGRLDAARSALEEVGRTNYPLAGLDLEHALLSFARSEGASALLRVAGTWPGDVNVQVEVLGRLVEAGHPVDVGLLSRIRDPRAELLLTWILVRDEARSRCEDLVAQHPQFAAAWLRLAQLQDSRADAVSCCRRGLEERPAHVPLLALLSRHCPEDVATREKLHALRPDLSDPLAVLDQLLLDGPSPFWGLPRDVERSLARA